MYKVFIDNHCITIDEQLRPEQEKGNFLLINEPGREELRILIEYLSGTSAPIDLIILSEKTNRLWNCLQEVCPLVLAAGGVVKNQKDEILFIYRNGFWDLPKGKAEAGEKLEDCALREVSEECGFEVEEINKKLPCTYHIYFHKTDYVLKETHWYEMRSSYEGKFKPQKKEGITKVKWFDKNALQLVKKNTYRNINDLLNKII